MVIYLFQEEMDSFGKSIKIVHKHGVTTLYGHLHRLKVKKGDFVTEGEIIGKWVRQVEQLELIYIMR